MNRLLNKYPYQILLLALIFMSKAFYLAFFVTPLWDIPDEIGHFSYARDLAEGNGLPLLGKAMIKADVMAHVSHNQNAKPAANWIAQHPPIYYLLAAVPLKIGMVAATDPELLFRLPRLVAAISGGLLLLVLFRTMRTLGLDNYRATALAAAIGFIPMVSHLASGTNNDITLFLFSALVVHFLARFLLHRQLSDAYWCAAWMTLAAGTKMTAWVVIPPLLAVFALEVKGPVKYWLKHISGVMLVTLFMPIMWMARNLFYFKNPFFTATTNASWQLKTPLSDSFLTFLESVPATDHFIVNFYGLIGWIGTGGGDLNWFQVSGPPKWFFSITLLAASSIIIFWVVLTSWRILHQKSFYIPDGLPANTLIQRLSQIINKLKLMQASLIIAFVISITIYAHSFQSTNILGVSRTLSVSFIIFSSITSLGTILYMNNSTDRLLSYCLICFIFFTSIIFWQTYGIYLLDGRMRATHGRYFYPVVPFIVAAFAIIIHRLHVPRVVLAAFVAIMAIMELETFVFQALPFYGDTGL